MFLRLLQGPCRGRSENGRGRQRPDRARQRVPLEHTVTFTHIEDPLVRFV